MFGFIWHTIFFDPVYNGLVFFIDVIPGGDVGLAIICITILVKTILLPLSIKATKTQVVIKEIEPKLKALKEKITDRQEQARAMMDLYKEAGINPFASILLMFLQIPILIGLYFAVSKGGGVPLPDINTTLLYSFVPNPEVVNMIFLGVQDITAKSLPIALVAGVAQFVQASMTIPKPAPRVEGETPSMKEEFTRNMQMQMRYVMPLLIFFIAYTLSAAIAIYFTVSALMAIGQEYVVKRYR